MENENKEEISINDPDLNLLCIFSFDVILSFFDKKEEIKPNFPEKFKKYSYPLFVTWSKGEDHHLRGCIGTFTSDNLEKNLAAYSLYAAFKDSRFPPLKLEEVKDLNCGISLLVNFENVDNIYDWEIGKHGIQIEFESDRWYTQILKDSGPNIDILKAPHHGDPNGDKNYYTKFNPKSIVITNHTTRFELNKLNVKLQENTARKYFVEYYENTQDVKTLYADVTNPEIKFGRLYIHD